MDFKVSHLEPMTVISDKELLTQITQILMANALKFTNRGSISLKLKRRDNVVEIRVKDTGIGIEQSKQRKLFQLFGNMKFKKSINQGGTGIGLFLCKELCSLLDAEISLKSYVGLGSTFTVQIKSQVQED